VVGDRTRPAAGRQDVGDSGQEVRVGLGAQNRKYLWAMGRTSAGSQTSSSPSACTA
jgi:hypothetical protein